MFKPRLRMEGAKTAKDAMELIDQVLDTLGEYGNGVSDNSIREADSKLMKARNLLDEEFDSMKTRPRINEFSDEVHQNAVKHGWWMMAPSFPEVIALCHSELSEALEEYRKDGGVRMVYYEDGVPHGIAFELADVILRILDYCGHMGIDIEKCLEEKNNFNRNRPYRHGGKVI